MSEPAKKQTVTAAADTTNPAPAGFDVQMEWIHLIPKDMTVGAQSLFQRVTGRKPGAPNGQDIYWSRTDRQYWIGTYNNGQLLSSCEIWEGHVGTRQRRE